jgi:hypothetical protein
MQICQKVNEDIYSVGHLEQHFSIGKPRNTGEPRAILVGLKSCSIILSYITKNV